MSPALDGRGLALALSLLAFLGLALFQAWGLLQALTRRPAGAERRAVLEELVWVGVAVGTVLAALAWGWRPSSG